MASHAYGRPEGAVAAIERKLNMRYHCSKVLIPLHPWPWELYGRAMRTGIRIRIQYFRWHTCTKEGRDREQLITGMCDIFILTY
jgi:hypothetical protein